MRPNLEMSVPGVQQSEALVSATASQLSRSVDLRCPLPSFLRLPMSYVDFHDFIFGDCMADKFTLNFVVPHMAEIPPPLPWVSGGVGAYLGSIEDLEERQ